MTSSSEFNDEQFLEYTERIYKEKTKGNEYFKKGENEGAVEQYQSAIEIGDKLFKAISTEEKKSLKENSYFEKFISELKNAYSNLAAVYLRQNKHKEIIDIDKFIIANLDEFFDKSYARLILSYWNLSETDNATNFYMIMLKKFDFETIKKYEEQLKPVAEKSKEIIENMRREYNHKNQANSGAKQGMWMKIAFFVVVIVFYIFGRGPLKGLFGGSPDIASKHNITAEGLNADIPTLRMTDSDESINNDLEGLKDEDLAIDTPQGASTDEDLDDKNSL